MATPSDLLDRVTASESDPRPVPRTLIVVAHPDDEVIALGGRLARHRNSTFLHVTDGAPRNNLDATAHGLSLEAYRAARKRELQRASDLAGIPSVSQICLNIPDQEALFHFAEICSHLEDVFARVRPEVVLTHPYEGGHPDHDVCAAALHISIDRYRATDRPLIVEAAFYHMGPQGIETGTFLARPLASKGIDRMLNAEEQEKKRGLLACFPTQRDTLAFFGTEIERYRMAPRYDFTEAPHPGQLFYEKFDWGASGHDFRRVMAQEMACR